MQDEEGLVGEAVRGDQGAFARLYEAHFDRIYRYVYLKIGDREEAEDMTQQVFLSALRSITSFKYQGTPFTAWLFRIAHNQIVDHFRKKTRRPVTLEIDETVPSGGAGPETRGRTESGYGKGVAGDAPPDRGAAGGHFAAFCRRAVDRGNSQSDGEESGRYQGAAARGGIGPA